MVFDLSITERAAGHNPGGAQTSWTLRELYRVN